MNLPKGAEKANFKINIKTADNIVIDELENGIGVSNKNSEPVEVFIGLEHGFEDLNIVAGSVQSRIEHINQKKEKQEKEIGLPSHLSKW